MVLEPITLIQLFGAILGMVLLFEIIFELKQNKRMIYVFKPLLMPIIIAMYIFFIINFRPFLNFDLIYLLGIIFGWIGDILLIESNSKKRFLFGLVVFLLGHLFYSISFILMLLMFNSDGSFFNSIAFLNFAFFIPVIILGILFIPKAINSMGEMKIPGTIYSIVIVVMHILATLFILSGIYLFTLSIWLGSLLFIISDIILAWNKFKKPIKLSKLWNMLTYVAGQFFMAMAMCILIL
ncbi:MAG: lysoplasmalogenase [Promethearchaeota archaeon]